MLRNPLQVSCASADPGRNNPDPRAAKNPSIIRAHVFLAIMSLLQFLGDDPQSGSSVVSSRPYSEFLRTWMCACVWGFHGACPTSAGGPVRSRDQMGHKVGHALRIGRVFYETITNILSSRSPPESRLKGEVRAKEQGARWGRPGPAEVATLRRLTTLRFEPSLDQAQALSRRCPRRGNPPLNPGRANPTRRDRGSAGGTPPATPGGRSWLLLPFVPGSERAEPASPERQGRRHSQSTRLRPMRRVDPLQARTAPRGPARSTPSRRGRLTALAPTTDGHAPQPHRARRSPSSSPRPRSSSTRCVTSLGTVPGPDKALMLCMDETTGATATTSLFAAFDVKTEHGRRRVSPAPPQCRVPQSLSTRSRRLTARSADPRQPKDTQDGADPAPAREASALPSPLHADGRVTMRATIVVGPSSHYCLHQRA